MSAAASAAKIRTRYRFRIATDYTSSDVPSRLVQNNGDFPVIFTSARCAAEALFSKCVC
jgi:hypothetical protein